MGETLKPIWMVRVLSEGALRASFFEHLEEVAAKHQGEVNDAVRKGELGKAQYAQGVVDGIAILGKEIKGLEREDRERQVIEERRT